MSAVTRDKFMYCLRLQPRVNISFRVFLTRLAFKVEKLTEYLTQACDSLKKVEHRNLIQSSSFFAQTHNYVHYCCVRGCIYSKLYIRLFSHRRDESSETSSGRFSEKSTFVRGRRSRNRVSSGSRINYSARFGLWCTGRL